MVLVNAYFLSTRGHDDGNKEKMRLNGEAFILIKVYIRLSIGWDSEVIGGYKFILFDQLSK